jgi:dephospho-CoA kinase
MAYFVGLTGGIGAGKTAVGEMLARLGAVIVDADSIVREIQEPGTDGFREIVEAFGSEIVGRDGKLNRQMLADVVFNDPEKLKQLESITHPKVGARFAERARELQDTDEIVILDIPLLGASKSGSERFADAVIVVTASPDKRISRLLARGLPREDAEARIAAQISDEERLKLADHVITNDGTIEELTRQVDELWRTLQAEAKEKEKSA